MYQIKYTTISDKWQELAKRLKNTLHILRYKRF